eukprot:COSAG06_NODE_9551_length_1873_cov_1.619504_2_plen_75_part_00
MLDIGCCHVVLLWLGLSWQEAAASSAAIGCHICSAASTSARTSGQFALPIIMNRMKTTMKIQVYCVKIHYCVLK